MYLLYRDSLNLRWYENHFLHYYKYCRIYVKNKNISHDNMKVTYAT